MAVLAVVVVLVVLRKEAARILLKMAENEKRACNACDTE